MRIILLGPPGAGKGTQASILKEKYDIAHVATGDIFRYNIANKTPLGMKAKEFTDRGDLVPDEITINMISDRLDQADCKKGFILDGFPRNVAQAEALEKMLKEKDIKLDAVVEMAVDDDKLVKRITGRFSCSDCGEGYNDESKKPHDPHTCDKCHAEEKVDKEGNVVGKPLFIRRADDNEATVRNRLDVYHKQTQPILPFYKDRGLLKTVDGMAPMADVTSQILAVLGKKRVLKKILKNVLSFKRKFLS